MDCTIFSALDHHRTIQHSSSECNDAVGILCPALADIICRKIDTDALLNLISPPEGIRRITSNSKISLDIRGEGSALDVEHRAAFLNAGITLLTEDILPRRPSLLLLPHYQEEKPLAAQHVPT
jgi:hypothetical protein